MSITETETLQDEIAFNTYALQRRCWEKDYFTSSLPWQQRGVAPALPISGSTSAVWASSLFAHDLTDVSNKVSIGTMNAIVGHHTNALTSQAQGQANNMAFMNDNIVDLSSATTFNVADLRLVFQIQKFLERNARAGARYTEF